MTQVFAKPFVFLSKLLIAFTLFLHLSIQAAPITEIKILRGEGEYLPYETKTKTGEYKGIYLDILLAVLNNMNIKVSFEKYPWGRALYMMEKGKGDAIMTPFKTAERERFLYFPKEPLDYEHTVLFTHKSSPIKFNGDLHSLTGYTIGKLLNYSYGPKIDAIEFPDTVIKNDQGLLIKLLALKRIDIIIGTQAVVNYQAKQAGYQDDIKVLDPPITKDAAYLAFSKIKGVQYLQLAEEFSQALVKFKKTQAYLDIIDKYGQD